MRVYILLHNFGLVCISEIYLDLTTAPGDKNLEIAGYNLLGADHASNYESGGVCVYYKRSLALRFIDVCYLQECLIFQIFISGELCNSISLYWLPSQPSESFEKFADNFNSH